MGHGHKGTTALCKISSLCCGVVKALALLGCYTDFVGTCWAPLIWNAWNQKRLRFQIFSDFGILANYNETAWGWEPNPDAKSTYVSYTAYEYIGFIEGIKTNWALNLITTSNWELNLLVSTYVCTALRSCWRANVSDFGGFRILEFWIGDIQPVVGC
jgi:hypothetical protein